MSQKYRVMPVINKRTVTYYESTSAYIGVGYFDNALAFHNVMQTVATSMKAPLIYIGRA